MPVRPVDESEYEEIANLRVDAYVTSGSITDHDSPYAKSLRDVATHARHGQVLVAEVDGALVGTVTTAALGAPMADICRSGEWEIRFLAVAATSWGTGIGEELMAACEDLARSSGVEVLALSVITDNAVAHRLYTRLGFTREPTRDFSPSDGVTLEVYTRAVDRHGMPRVD